MARAVAPPLKSGAGVERRAQDGATRISISCWRTYAAWQVHWLDRYKCIASTHRHGEATKGQFERAETRPQNVATVRSDPAPKET